MSVLIQEIIKLLTSTPGSLTYHLVLAFAITISLQGAITTWRATQFPQARRMVIGLVLLLLLRVALYVMGGVAWQGLINEHILLPPVDRAILLLSLIVILWMWIFPEPSRLADTASVLMALLVATMFGLNWTWWSQNGSQIAYNGSWPDFISAAAALFLLGCGSLLLVLRRPNGWGVGLGMLAAEAVGYALYLTLPTPQGDFAGIVRLAQMVAYPMLGFLPQRFPAPAAPVETSAPAQQERRRYGADPRLLDSYLALGSESTPEKILQALSRTVAQTLLADLCLVVSPPDAAGDIAVQCGYDLIREEQVPGSLLPARTMPLLAASLGRGLPLRLPASSTSVDLKTLAQKLNLQHPGHLLSVCVVGADGAPLCGLVLLSPYSNRAWNAEEQSLLANFARPMAHLLQRSLATAALQNQILQTNGHLQTQSEQLQAAVNEKEVMRLQLQQALEELNKNRTQAESLAALIAAQEETQGVMARLQAENLRLKQSAAEVTVPLKAAVFAATDPGELRMAMEEVARLETALRESEEKLQALASQRNGSAEQAAPGEEIANIVQELRQPMSSVLGYTDFLLGESIGILGTLQRKFLERVKMSSERMSRLVDDLVRITSPGSDSWRSLPVDMLDVKEVAQDAVNQLKENLDARQVSVKLDFADKLPELAIERESLQQALANLVENAAEVSPPGSQISLLARVEGEESKQRYVLLQVTDLGGGIPVDYLPRVFSRFSQADGKPIPGTASKGTSLSIVRVLVENVGGRIWVDSEPGSGSTFSMLLPVNNEPAPQDLQAGEYNL